MDKLLTTNKFELIPPDGCDAAEDLPEALAATKKEAAEFDVQILSVELTPNGFLDVVARGKEMDLKDYLEDIGYGPREGYKNIVDGDMLNVIDDAE